jgi:hypothetical protein
MTALTAQELTDMRAIADDFFPDTCTIQTFTPSVGSAGGASGTYANTYTGVACRVDPAQNVAGGETIVNEALEGRSMWVLNIPYDQAISISDRVIHSSVTYEVRSVWDTHSYSTIRRASLTRVN